VARSTRVGRIFHGSAWLLRMRLREGRQESPPEEKLADPTGIDSNYIGMLEREEIVLGFDPVEFLDDGNEWLL
jgi:hypothetical protein